MSLHIRAGCRCEDRVCGKVISLDEGKDAKTKDGKAIRVADMTLVDDSGASFSVAVWEDAGIDKMSTVRKGEGISLIGCTATKDSTSGEFRINVWKNVHVISGGSRAEQLTRMSSEQVDQCQTLTASSSGAPPSLDLSGKEVVPVTATALASFPSDGDQFPTETYFQLNRASVSAPLSAEQMTTKSGERLWVSTTVSDWTGSASVHFANSCAPILYDCKSTEEVLEKARQGSLELTKSRLNLRGVIRVQDGGVRKIVAEAKKSGLISQISSESMRRTKGLSPILPETAQVVPADRLEIDAVSGMSVLADGTGGEMESISCARIFLLVTGTEDTEMEPLDDQAAPKDQSFQVTSPRARCLLSTTETLLDLVGYCDYKKVPKFTLHQNSAFVSVSNFHKKEDGRLVASVEDIQPVSGAEVPAVKKSMDVEWKTALTKIGTQQLDSYSSPTKPEWWIDQPRKVARIDSDPMTPERKASA